MSAPVNTRVLAFLSSVAGDALTRHLGVILPAVMLALKEKLGTPDEQLVRGTVTPAVSLLHSAESWGPLPCIQHTKQVHQAREQADG